jgi:hypothetical protein
MSIDLSSGFCQLVHSDQEIPDGYHPVVQCLSVKKINAINNTGQDRYR